ncbi:MAG: SulP family sulfate permease [Gammaproteobacteria bacterium]|jgi:SulP family sulfate permease
MWRQFLPFLLWWPEVNRKTLRADGLAGLTGAIVVLPQGVAFATIAGMPPEYGLYAAMVPAVVAALFGSSRLLVSGPTTAASVVLFSTLSTMAAPGTATYVYFALTLTFMVGCIQLAMGLARLGHLVNFISHSVIVGFTAGAALLIASSQTKHFLGIDLPSGLQVYQVVTGVFQRVAQIDWMTVLVGLLTVGSGLAARRWFKQVPYMLIAISVGTVAGLGFNEFLYGNVALVGVTPEALPPLSMPSFSFTTWQELAPAALAVTLFALTEAVSIARSLAARTGDLIDGNQEFIGQGLSNMVGAFFSGYVATGSFNRSAVNYEAGARTPLSSVFAAVLLVAVLLAVAPLLSYMPKASMAGVLYLVAVGLVDVQQIRIIFRASRTDATVLAVTFAATLLFELDFAIMLGVMLSLVIYLHQASRPRVLVRVPDPRQPRRRFNTDATLPECPQMKLVRIDGALFFGAVNYVAERLRVIFKRNPEQKHLLILARPINFIDVAGAEMLARENATRKGIGGGIYLHQLKEDSKALLRRGGFYDEIGDDNFFDHKGEAIAGIFDKLDKNICARCSKRIFNECKTIPRMSGATSATLREGREKTQPRPTAT